MPDSMIRLSIAIPGSQFSQIEIVRRLDRRHIRLTNGRRNCGVGRYASVKMGTTFPWESRLELYDLYRAEVDPRVVSYAVQPETLHWECAGKRQLYTPDRLDVMIDGKERIIEIKDRFDPHQHPEYTEKLRQARQIYTALGRAFELRQRSQISIEPDFSAIEEIQAYRRSVVTARDIQLVRMALGKGKLPLREALRSLERPSPRPVLFAMMVRRIVSIDVSHGMHENAAVSTVEQANE